MTTTNRNDQALPAIITQWIETLESTTTPEHIKDNYRLIMTNVIRHCEAAVARYDASKMTSGRRRPSPKRD